MKPFKVSYLSNSGHFSSLEIKNPKVGSYRDVTAGGHCDGDVHSLSPNIAIIHEMFDEKLELVSEKNIMIAPSS